MIAEVRIDKWLWCVRAFKTRSLAAAACNAGTVSLNGNPAKPGRDVRMGDTVSFRQGIVTRTLKALTLPRSRVGAKDLPGLIEDLTPPEEYEKAKRAEIELVAHRDRGAGRPTKRDRRETDRLTGEDA